MEKKILREKDPHRKRSSEKKIPIEKGDTLFGSVLENRVVSANIGSKNLEVETTIDHYQRGILFRMLWFLVVDELLMNLNVRC